MKYLRSVAGIALCVFLLIACTGKKQKLLDSTVQTSGGKLKGYVNESGTVVVFKGIPYAAPPVGNLRWREPQPPASWEGVRDATAFGANAVQVNNRRLPWTDEYMIRGEMNEDCLFLNVWTPAKSADDNLPVLVYIHGGGLREGSGSIDVYDGEELARKGIVVVTLNYRVGVLGFLSHPWLSDESGRNASGNYGFMDQVAALNWIKENIAAFGGNPGKVTVAGQSAGSRSVHVLTASPLAAGLIHGAATFSGASMGRITGFTSKDTALARGVKYVESLGVSSLDELRALPAEKLIADFGGCIDGYVLPVSIAEIFEKGSQNDVPAIAGLVSDEGSSNPKYGKNSLAEFKADAIKKYGANAGTFFSLYPATSDEESGLRSVELARESGRVDLLVWADFRAKTAKTPAFTYYFSRGIPWPEHPEFGAFHTGDVIYWFNNLKKLDRPWTQTDTLVAETASSYLVNFVASGNPNGEGLPIWSAFDGTKPVTLEIGTNIQEIPVATDQKTQFLKQQ